jgi:hypothetical protein
MNTEAKIGLIEDIAETIEIPESAYESAERRYKDLGEWFGRADSQCRDFAPHIHAQGSFRLGTVNRPFNNDDFYDLDLACKLNHGVIKTAHTQEQLKQFIGREIEAYRIARGIAEEKKEKPRCWRLEYADHLSFHMDIVPCIPEDVSGRTLIMEQMVKRGVTEALASTVAALTVSITDTRHPNYRTVNLEWYVSNPEGYARWFESRMRMAGVLLERRALQARAKVEELPVFRWKTPLQRCVQILKRHRDIMFCKKDEYAPISIILTTLAGRAYNGEQSVRDAMVQILEKMGNLVNAKKPRVPNPVNPAEDFSDKWDTEEGRSLRLEQNFWAWLTQARSDFATINTSDDLELIAEQARNRFGSSLNARDLRQKYKITAPAIITTPKSHAIVEAPARPWSA